MPKMIRTLAILLALVSVAVSAAPAGATSIVAVVNDQPITSYAVAQRARLLQLTTGAKNMRRRALEELIDESLQIAETKRAGIEVSKAEVDAAYAGIAKRVKLPVAQLTRALRQAGVDPQTLRDRLRAQIGWARLVRAKFNAGDAVTEQDLVAALLKKGGKTDAEVTEYDLQEVVVALPKNPRPARLAEAKRRAEELRGQFASCKEGIPMARDARETVVRPIGKRLDVDLPPGAAEILSKVEVGRLSKPMQQDHGLVMYAVCGKQTVHSTAAAMKSLEPEIRNEKGDLLARQYLSSLRRNALIERR